MARKVPFDDPDVLNYVRIGYVVSQVLILAVYYSISYKVSLLSVLFKKPLVDEESGRLRTRTTRLF